MSLISSLWQKITATESAPQVLAPVLLAPRPPQETRPEPSPQVLAEAEKSEAAAAEPLDMHAIARAETLAVMSELAPTLGQLDSSLQVLAASEIERRQVPQVLAAMDAPHAMENARQFTDWTNPRSHPPGFIDADTLRILAHSYDPLAACIAHLKDQVLKTPVFVVPKTDGDKTDTTRKQVEAAKAFFDVFGGLGGEGTDRLEFEGKWLDDLLIIGACALHCEYRTVGSLRDRRPDAIKPIDASTIRPLVTPFGWAPDEDNIAFEQWVQGKRVAGFARSELIYTGLPIFAQSYSPYFLSGVELLVMLVYTALKSDDWNRTWLTDGNVPDSMITVPKEWTPEQIKSYEVYFNRLMSGNSRQRHRAPIVPEGTSISHQTRKDADFQQFENWLMNRVCSLMGVNPASIGHHGDTYKDSQEIAKDSTRENRVAQLLRFRAVRYSDLCSRMGWDAIHVVEELPASEDAAARAARQEIELRSGTRTINECRAEAGEEPSKSEGADELFIAGTLVPLSRAMEPPAPPDGGATDAGKKSPGQSDSKDDKSGGGGGGARGDVARGIDTSTPDLPIRENLEGGRPPQVLAESEAKPEHKYDFSFVAVDLDAASAAQSEKWARENIAAANLSGSGIETKPHITVRYGLHTADVEDVAALYRGFGRIRAAVGSMMVFERDDFDVLVYEVESAQLQELHATMGRLPHTDSFNDYKPHITIAYVKKGAAAEWNGKNGPLTEEYLSFDNLIFSDRDGHAHTIDGVGDAREIERALKQWERKAINRLERGKSAACAFESECFDVQIEAQVLARLSECATKAEVRCVFADVARWEGQPRDDGGRFGHGLMHAPDTGGGTGSGSGGATDGSFEAAHQWSGDAVPEGESPAFQDGKTRALEKILPYAVQYSREAGAVVIQADGSEYFFNVGPEKGFNVDLVAPANIDHAVLHSHPDEFPHGEADWHQFLTTKCFRQSHVISTGATFSLHKPDGWQVEHTGLTEDDIDNQSLEFWKQVYREDQQSRQNDSELNRAIRVTRKMADYYGILFRVGKRK